MGIDKYEYAKLVKKTAPPSKTGANCLKAFLIGGTICVIGQLILEGLKASNINKEESAIILPLCMIALSVLLTAFGLYDSIARHAGAGTLVPITGFANAVSSAAIEYKTEGFVLGVGAKMFTIAGPVIVYGTVASVVYGIIYWVTTLF